MNRKTQLISLLTLWAFNLLGPISAHAEAARTLTQAQLGADAEAADRLKKGRRALEVIKGSGTAARSAEEITTAARVVQGTEKTIEAARIARGFATTAFHVGLKADPILWLFELATGFLGGDQNPISLTPEQRKRYEYLRKTYPTPTVADQYIVKPAMNWGMDHLLGPYNQAVANEMRRQFQPIIHIDSNRKDELNRKIQFKPPIDPEKLSRGDIQELHRAQGERLRGPSQLENPTAFKNMAASGKGSGGEPINPNDNKEKTKKRGEEEIDLIRKEGLNPALVIQVIRELELIADLIERAEISRRSLLPGDEIFDSEFLKWHQDQLNDDFANNHLARLAVLRGDYPGALIAAWFGQGMPEVEMRHTDRLQQMVEDNKDRSEPLPPRHTYYSKHYFDLYHEQSVLSRIMESFGIEKIYYSATIEVYLKSLVETMRVKGVLNSNTEVRISGVPSILSSHQHAVAHMELMRLALWEILKGASDHGAKEIEIRVGSEESTEDFYYTFEIRDDGNGGQRSRFNFFQTQTAISSPGSPQPMENFVGLFHDFYGSSFTPLENTEQMPGGNFLLKMPGTPE